MHIGIMSQGAIASILAWRLQNLDLPYCVLSKRPLHPVQIETLEGKADIVLPPGCNGKIPDVLLVPLKAWQVMTALEPLAAELRQTNTVIALMHNGMGVAEQVHALLPDNPLLAITTRCGALRVESQRIRLTGIGLTQAGAVANISEPHMAQLTELFSRLLPPFEWQQDINQVLWDKLAINAVINPLSALYQCKNGELLQPRFDLLHEQLAAEIAAVMDTAGVSRSAAQLLASIRAVEQATAQNYSSMNRDVAAGKPTEIDFINGFIKQKGAATGIATPLNNELVELIQDGKPPRW